MHRPASRERRRTAAWTVACGGLLAVAAAAATAAEGWELGTDRDAFTPCTHTVAAGMVLFEASSVYIDNRSGLPTNNYPESLFRIGTGDRFEWRFGVNYGAGSQGSVVTSVEVGEGTPDGSRRRLVAAAGCAGHEGRSEPQILGGGHLRGDSHRSKGQQQPQQGTRHA